ncbi:hypothetical protein SPFM12_00268 [Salmonella phage SPFM12]|nr:hypothetical protein SPFM12_00268 [Salmonella phage SPFM12]
MLGGLGGLGGGSSSRSSNNLLGGSTQLGGGSTNLFEALRGNAVTKESGLGSGLLGALRENNGHLPKGTIKELSLGKAQQASSANSFNALAPKIQDQQAPQENLDLNDPVNYFRAKTDFRIGRTPAGTKPVVALASIQTLPYNTGPRTDQATDTTARPLEEEWIGQLDNMSVYDNVAQYVTNYNQVVRGLRDHTPLPSVTGSNDPRPYFGSLARGCQRKQDKVIIFNLLTAVFGWYKHMFEEESLDGTATFFGVKLIFISSDMTIEGIKYIRVANYAVKNYVYGLLEEDKKTKITSVVCADLKDPTMDKKLVQSWQETAAEGKNIRLAAYKKFLSEKKAINANLFLKSFELIDAIFAFHPLCESVLAGESGTIRFLLPTAAMIKRGLEDDEGSECQTIDDGHPAMFTYNKVKRRLVIEFYRSFLTSLGYGFEGDMLIGGNGLGNGLID